jgi:hypothetical protein
MFSFNAIVGLGDDRIIICQVLGSLWCALCTNLI